MALVRGVAALLFGFAGVARGAGPALSPEIRKQELISLLTHGDQVEATTSEGFYQADRQARVWRPVEVPPSLAPGGQFVAGPPGSGVIYYHPILNFDGSKPRTGSWVFGLYRQSARSPRWELVHGPAYFQSVLVLEKSIYGITLGEPWTKPVQKFIRSFDQGKTWEDLTAKLPATVTWVGLIPDPDHPGQACVRAQGLRASILQADENSDHWREVRGTLWGPWEGKHPTEATHFAPRFTTGSMAPTLHATLQNYFEYPFGDTVEIPSLAMTVNGDRTFAVGAPLLLPVELSLRTDVKVGTLMDTPDETVCWSLRRRMPNGKYEAVGPRPLSAGTPAAQGHQLTRKTPYQRTINLRALADFREPGKYRVQLLYTSYALAQRAKGQWPLEITGPILDLEVKP